MADELLIKRSWGNVDVQIGGPGNSWIYLSACAAMSGPEVPFGDTETRWCQDPGKAGGFRRSSKIRTAPDLITFDLITKLQKVNILKRLGCPFSLRARYASCGEREDPSNYDPLILAYCPVDINSKTYDGNLVITTPEDDDEIMVTNPSSADYEYEIRKINGGRTGTAATLGDQPINDVEYCGAAQCGGYCGDENDGCGTIYGVTDTDTTPYTNPSLVKGEKNLNNGTITWSNLPILGLNNNVENIECAGKRLVVSSNGDRAVAYNDDPNQDQDEWVVVSLNRTPTALPNALHMRNAREGYLACNGGYILKTVDGGANWTEVHSATITTQNINSVFAYDKDLVYAVGNAGVILKSEDGGQTWVDKTQAGVTSANLLVVIVPPNRPREVYIGTNNGRIYRSTEGGDNLARITFFGDSVGSVDDLAFCGPCAGDVLFILHNDGGPRGRVLRDLSGGAGGADVEEIVGYTQVIQAGIDLNALACCDSNEAIAVGELNNSYPVVVKIS